MTNDGTKEIMRLLGFDRPIAVDVETLKTLVVKSGDATYVVDWDRLLKDYGIPLT